MNKKLTLYTNPMSRGRVARWMLEEVGAPYESEVIAFGPDMKTEAYLAIHPLGKVPALRHGDTVVTETAAICAYLADAFPDAGLAPEPKDRGAYYQWLFFAAGPLEACLTDSAMGWSAPDDKKGMLGYGEKGAMLDVIEKAVSSGPYVAGETFSAADVYVGANIGWYMEIGTIEKRPAFEDYWSRISSRESWKHATELDDRAEREAEGET